MRTRVWHKQFLRFGIVGAISTSVYFVSTLTLVYIFDLRLIVANTYACFASFVVSYLGSALWSFEAGGEAKSLIKFLVLAFSTLAITSFISIGVTEHGVPEVYSIATITVIIPIISFTVQKLWVFQR